MWLNCAKDQSRSLFSVTISHHSVNEATVFTSYPRNITSTTEPITTGNNSPHVGESKRPLVILDSTPWIPDTRYWIQNSLSVELGSEFQSLMGLRDFLSCIPDSKRHDHHNRGVNLKSYKRLMGMCRWMGSHFQDRIDYNGVAFSIELLEWGRTFSDSWGKTVLHIYG